MVFTSNRKYNGRDLNGSNVIITLIDSGVLINNFFFNDPNYPKVTFNTTDVNHRKIVRYDIFTNNNFFKSVRHGTHYDIIPLSSTDTIPLNLYNGHAPGAKIYVGDIGIDEEESIGVSFTFNIFEQSKILNSPIIPCSWGDPDTTPELTHMIDYLSYENPSQLFVFAAGNEYFYYRIGSPGISKNVLTVTSSDPPRSYYLSDSTHAINIVDWNAFLVVSSPNFFSTMKRHENSYLGNIELINYNEGINENEYQSIAVVINGNYDYFSFKKIFDLILLNKAKVAIVFDSSSVVLMACI